jgi:uncharacterized protein YndB with AHSA1/START domain
MPNGTGGARSHVTGGSTLYRQVIRNGLGFCLVEQDGGKMAEIDGSRDFDFTADALWAVVADPARLADWVPTMRLAQSAGREEVHVEGESHGHPYSLDSMLRIDEGDRRLHWGAEGEDGYRGSLRVVARPSGSEVHLHVAIPDDRLGPSPDRAAAEIRQGIQEAFDRLAGLIAT